MTARRDGGGAQTANMDEAMPTSTLAISSSFVIGARDLRVARATSSRRRYAASAIGGCCSTAGLDGRTWLKRLRRALSEDRFVLHYQPIVSLREGCIAGARPTHYEALIRLADGPHGALAAPAEFLPAAERHGLIAQIDRWVIASVIELLGEGACGAQTRIAVNLSAQSIVERGTLSYVERLLARRGVDARRLIVEVTETSAIADMTLASAFCERFQRLGGAIALDDFGAGFGSLQYLKRLPFDYLKIDGQFVRSLPHSHSDRLLVQALVGVARGMRKQTIAEYAGGPSSVSLLRELGVDYAQGFELGRPACPLEAFSTAP